MSISVVEKPENREFTVSEEQVGGVATEFVATLNHPFKPSTVAHSATTALLRLLRFAQSLSTGSRRAAIQTSTEAIPCAA